jgi:hypothetical protein
MVFATQPSPASVSTGQLARALPGFDPGPAINAHESNLADYLNRPVHDVLARFGRQGSPQAAPPPGAPKTPTDPTHPNGGSPAGAQNAGMLSGLAGMLIQPVTEALGTLGSGQFGDLDPTQMFGGIAQAFESAGQSMQPAMAGLDGVWQGQASSAAAAQTTAALADGTQVASQATGLADSLSAATASVAQTQAQLVEIINQFSATMAAIGPNIIFPWGMAAAIAAASQAATMTSEAMTQLESSLGAEAANATAVGSPVAVTSASGAGATAATTGAAAGTGSAIGSPIAALTAPLGAALGAPGAAAGGSGGALSSLASLAPMMQLGTGLASPAMSAMSAATGAMQSGAGGAAAPAQLASSKDQDPTDDGNPDHRHDHKGGPHGGGVGGGGKGAAGPIPIMSAQSRPLAVTMPETEMTHAAIEGEVPVTAATSGAPMMGGTPMGAGARAGVSKSHTAAAFLHTSDQGDEIVGDLGSVAPPVIGVREPTANPNVDLRI